MKYAFWIGATCAGIGLELINAPTFGFGFLAFGGIVLFREVAKVM